MSAIALDPLIAEAKERARRRRLLALVAAGLIAAGVLAFELAPSSGGSGSGSGASAPASAIRWLPTKPYLGPANPPLAPPCTAGQLHASLYLQASTGSWGGTVKLVNRSSKACALVGRPQLSLGRRRATKYGTNPGPPAEWFFDPLAPPIGSLRALAPGGHAQVAVWWGGVCQGVVRAKAVPQIAALRAPGGGNVHMTLPGTFPSCNFFSGSTPGATRFFPYVPGGPRSTALPLRASIGSGLHRKDFGGPTLVAHRGSWLSFTVVLTNRSKHAFRFGRTCPPYKEGVSYTQDQVYVLNCHGVGAIVAGASVRFAMRVHVPAHAPDVASLGWTLAPHSYHASDVYAQLEFR